MQEIWGLIGAYAERGAAEGKELWVTIAPFLDQAVTWISNPWARAIGLTVIVYLTIRVIASVYSGDKQNSELGPIGIRPHAAQRLGRETIVLPRTLMPMNIESARRVAKAREGNALQRWMQSGHARRRANVIGSYYVKFEFSHDPFFVLTRHPDRELKMTAWLTVLTSMFALVMDAWPKEATHTPSTARDHPATVHDTPSPPPRVTPRLL